MGVDAYAYTQICGPTILFVISSFSHPGEGGREKSFIPGTHVFVQGLYGAIHAVDNLVANAPLSEREKCTVV